eukprot:gene8012-9857_t
MSNNLNSSTSSDKKGALKTSSSSLLSKVPAAPSLPINKLPPSPTYSHAPSSPNTNNLPSSPNINASSPSTTYSPILGGRMNNSSKDDLKKSSLGSSSSSVKNSVYRASTTLAQLTGNSLPTSDSSPPSSLISSSSSPTTESLIYSSDQDGNHDPNTKMGHFTVGLKGTSAGEVSKIGHSSCCTDEYLYIFGGSTIDGNVTNDFYSFHFATRTWTLITSSNGPMIRTQHSAVLFNNSMYIFGGTSASGPKNDLFVYSFDTQMWSEVSTEGNKPTPRFGHSAVVDGNQMFIFGGNTSDSNATNELYCLNLDSKVWSLISSSGAASARSFHTATVHRGVMWVIGGQDSNSNLLDDIHCYSIPNNNWKHIQTGEGSSFSPRSNHSASLLQDSIFITGGNTSSSSTKQYLEIFELDLYQKKWFRIQTTIIGQNRIGHTSNIRGATLLLWGGTNSSDSSIDYLSFGKDEFEEDNQEDDIEINRMQNIPKFLWESTLMKKHPEILEWRERTSVLTGNKPYAKSLAMPSFTENKNAISHQFVLQLIMEYLERHTSYHKTIQIIQKESGVLHQPTESGESRLVSLLRLAKPRLRSKNVFDPDLDIYPKEEGVDPEIQVVDNLYRRIENEEEDINVWDEGEDTSRNIRKTESENGTVSIRAATLNKLIHYLAPEKEKANDINFLKAVLYTHQSFTTSDNLLKKLIQRYSVPSAANNNDPKYKQEFVEPIRQRVCSAIKYWIDKCPWDFRSGPNADKLVASLNNFIDGALTRDGNTSIKKLRNLLVQVRTNVLSSSLVYSTNPPEPKVPKNIFSPQLTLAHIDELEIARQLTLIEYRIFRNIPPPEFLVRVTSYGGEFQYNMATSPNLITFLNRSTDVSKWVQYMILTQDNKKSRSKMIDKFIKIMECLRTLNNFQTLHSVYLGLQKIYTSSENTQNTVDLFTIRAKEIMTEHDNLFSRNDKFKTYREVLGSAKPCIPLVMVLQEDIAFIERDQPSLMNNLINFVKRQNLYAIISKIEQYQLSPYNLQPVHQVSTFVNKLPKISDSDLSDYYLKPIS